MFYFLISSHHLLFSQRSYLSMSIYIYLCIHRRLCCPSALFFHSNYNIAPFVPSFNSPIALIFTKCSPPRNIFFVHFIHCLLLNVASVSTAQKRWNKQKFELNKEMNKFNLKLSLFVFLLHWAKSDIIYSGIGERWQCYEICRIVRCDSKSNAIPYNKYTLAGLRISRVIFYALSLLCTSTSIGPDGNTEGRCVCKNRTILSRFWNDEFLFDVRLFKLCASIWVCWVKKHAPDMCVTSSSTENSQPQSNPSNRLHCYSVNIEILCFQDE